MAPTTFIFSLLAIALQHHLFLGEARTFTITNNCGDTVWPGILSNAGVAPLSTTGFALQKGESKPLDVPANWGGRLWGRTLCSTDSAGKFTCKTGDCGSGKVECSGAGAKPPASLAEFTLDGADSKDFYDVSLVDGYNVQMLVAPKGGKGDNCTSTGCEADLNGACPSELRVAGEGDGGNALACRSACEAFNKPEYCCNGAFSTPDTCKPTNYSEIFKKACPRAYSYAYDDKSSTFTCLEKPDYTITFCPSSTTTSRKISSNITMKYDGSLDKSSAPHVFKGMLCLKLIAGGMVFFTTISQLLQIF